MRKRMLGKSGIEVAPLGFGGNVFGWTADERATFQLIDRFVDAGFNLIDTADMYSIWVPGHAGGESETLIGRWLQKNKNKRSQVVIATKVGMDMGPGGKGLSKSHIEKSVDLSLRRLGVETIDLYQSHTDDLETPVEETLSAFTKLKTAGKIRAIGASNYSATRLAESLSCSQKNGLLRYETLQPRYNLCDRKEFEGDLQGICVRENIGVINYYSLAAGFLTGKYRTEADLKKSQRGQGAAGRYFNSESGTKVLHVLDEVSRKLKCSPAQVAIAWLNAQPSIAAPLASATSVVQLDELLSGAQLELDPESISQLNAAGV